MSLGIFPQETYYTTAIQRLAAQELRQLQLKDKFFRYATMVQPTLSVNDFMRILDSSHQLIGKVVDTSYFDELGPQFANLLGESIQVDLQAFLVRLKPEFDAKFSLFSDNAKSDGKRMDLCDFMVLLKALIQDQPSSKIVCESDSDGESIFRSTKASKIIMQEVYKYMYGVLKVDHQLEFN